MKLRPGSLKGIILINLCVCVYVLSCVQLFATLWTVAHQAPLFMELSRQEYCSGLPFSTPEDLPNPGIQLSLLCLLYWQVGSLPLCHLGNPDKLLPKLIKKKRDKTHSNKIRNEKEKVQQTPQTYKGS